MIVNAEGPRDRPKLAIVGEAPGEHEEREGRPFVGPSGFLLNSMLSAAGIARADCFITNVSNIRPPKNDFWSFYYEDQGKTPKSILLDQRQRLWEEIKLVQPSVVVAMGNEALKALTHANSIKNYRGTMIESFGIRCIPTYHPAYVLRMYETRPIVEADLKKALRQAINPSVPRTYFQPDPSFSEVMKFLQERPKRLSLDIETIKNTTRCIGLAWSKHEAISIPFISRGQHHWDLSQEIEILSALNALFLCPDVEFILQNAPYDFTILARDFGFQISNLLLDNMFAHHLLYPELPKGLDFQSSIYTDHPMYWGYDSKNDLSTRVYNCMDCVVTFESAEEIIKELKSRRLWEYYRSIIHPAVPALTRAQSRGVLIDSKAREEIAVTTKHEMEDTKLKINKLLDSELNPSSHKQVKELIYDHWHMPFQFKRQGQSKRITTDGDALKALARKCNDPTRRSVLENIVTFREKRVLLSTFAEMSLKNGRVHTSYNLAGTVTGRIASSSTFDGYGGNLQNIPRGSFRRIFVADPGKVLIKADLSQAEYRVLIWKARIKRVIERFKDPKFSIHMWNAAENIYRVPYSQVTKPMYDDAKNGVYGANYGIGALKVSRMYNIEFKDAKFIIERYHEAVPEIQQVYQAEIRDTINTTRSLINPLGRERLFFGRLDDELYRAAYSHFCQSTVADVILVGLAALDQGPSWIEVLLQVHDELVSQVPVERVREGVDFIRKSMSVPMRFDGVDEPLVIPVEIKVGRNWYDMCSVDDFEAKELGNAKALSQS